MNQAVSTELVTELNLGSARGGKAGSREPLVVQAVRGLTEADLPAIANPPVIGSAKPNIAALRHSHHRLAQLLAEGKEQQEVSLLTGYSQSYISTIQRDPAFADLTTYYTSQRDTVFIDAAERMKVLGLDAAEKLQERLHDQATEFSNRELMEVIELALGPSLAPKAAPLPGGASASLSLEVKFISAPSRAEGPQGPTLEGTFTDLTQKEPR